tara:strand:+ start:3544 stop:3912 length:369 start_codon:yes stop_codon:yes gene_type:complete
MRAVMAAAAVIREETGLTSAQAIGRIIASRVINLLLEDNRQVTAHTIGRLAGYEPISLLAFSEGFAAADELATKYWHNLEACFGLAIAPEFQQKIIRKRSAIEFRETLQLRYARHIRIARCG